ncbi:Ferritin, chloroplastic, partial [Linum grandiflorum]
HKSSASLPNDFTAPLNLHFHTFKFSQVLNQPINRPIMFLRTPPSFSITVKHGESLFAGHGSSFSTASPIPAQGREKRSSSLVASAAVGEVNSALTGIVFKPFEEVKREEFMVPISPQVSIARQSYVDESESAINEQINVEYNASYIYHSLYAYFDRDNVALKGFAKFFKESSEEERGHAEKLMEYQNVRGGRVKLHSILMPPSDFEHVEKGDALHAMELALSLEKLVNEKLLSLHSVASKNNDPQMAEFIEREFLNEQVESIKKISDYVTQLRLVGKGHGVWHFDQMLLDEA